MNIHPFTFRGNTIEYNPLERGEVEVNDKVIDWKLAVVLNYKCNFICEYCFSSKNRNNDKRILSFNDFKKAVEYICEIQKSRKDGRIFIIFLGGGEPFMSRKLLEKCVNYAYEQSIGLRRILRIVTNGSLLKESDIDWYKKYGVSLDVSYEIIEEIHNMQREHFDLVSKKIKILDDSGVEYKTRSVITRKNVDRMKEMVVIAKQRFPNIKELQFELVSAPSNDFVFYEAFLKNYFKAKETALLLGVKLNNSKFDIFNYLRKHHCRPECCLIPGGHLTMCHRYSSSLDKNFDMFDFGSDIDDFFNNQERVDKILNYSYAEECKHCIAEYHCGGGCHNININMPNIRRDFCKFMILNVKLHLVAQEYPELLKEYIYSPLTFDLFAQSDNNNYVPV